MRMRWSSLMLAAAAILGSAGVFVLSPASAQAAAPETPVTREAKSLTATSVVLHGELNPLASATAGYEFIYNTGGGCEGATTTTEGAEATGKAIQVSTPVTGLTPSTEYTFCVVATHAEGGEPPELAQGNPVTFKTLAEAPAVDSQGSSGVTPFEARLEATVNPDSQTSSCVFEAGETVAYGTKLACEPATLEGFSEQPVGATLSHLAAHTTYHFRVVMENAGHEKTYGADQQLTTLTLEAPHVESESAAGVTPFAATLEAAVNPGYQETSCKFEYGTEPSLATYKTLACDPSQLGAGGGPSGASLSLIDLTPATAYFYRVVAGNATGTSEGAITELKTLAAEKPVIESESTSALTPFEATLEAQINPEYQPSSCEFEYGSEPSLATHQTVACDPAELGDSGSATSASLTLSGLEAHKSYYYRVTTTNATGTSTGPIENSKH